MKKRILLILLLATPLFGTASHIVGGEFELIHIQGFTYRLNLVLYFDVLNGNPGALDDHATVRFFRMDGNVKVMDLYLPLTEQTDVSYTQPSCSHGEIVTRRLLYTAEITLNPTQFGDPGGYYVAWERCCRNYNISNIFSNDPAFNGSGWAGQTFYLEFPPVVKNGHPFVDSTPRLFPPLNDFACPNRPYYTDFKGIDDDGDSLVYSLTTPLSTVTSIAIPPPPNEVHPRPYPTVTWRPPYGPNNILNGSPDLRISHDGFLTVKPTNQGLFVFAVKVEEYRNKVKIGETRRDFQMLVVDACPVAQPPNVMGKKLSDPTFTYDNTMSVSFASTTPDGQRCINLRISDPDSQSPDDNFQENIRIKAFAMNFSSDLTSIIPTINSATLTNGSTAEFTVCFPACPLLNGATPIIGLIAMDDACSLPLTDTLKLTLLVEPPPNAQPQFISANPITATLPEGSQQSWPWSVVDSDGDEITLSVVTNGFELNTAGMTFEILNQALGSANGILNWDAYCDIYDFTHQTSFKVTVKAEDNDQCNVPGPAKAIFNLDVILPGNADPIIDTDLTPVASERTLAGIQLHVNDPLTFTVTGKDIVDNDMLTLTLTEGGINLAEEGISVTPIPIIGPASVSTQFQWTPNCTSVDLSQRDTYNFQFIVIDDKNKCRLYKADTVDVEVKLLPPINHLPQLNVVNNSEDAELKNGTLSLVMGGSIDLTLVGNDNDVTPQRDNLTLELVAADGNVLPRGYSFVKAEGTGPIESDFTWKPDCRIFSNGVYENEYNFVFKLADDHCLSEATDSLTLTIKIRDIDGPTEEFVPPNFVSPNGDSKNDYYSMDILVPETGEMRTIMPPDNCNSRFEHVSIYNRWGKEVYHSTERNFKWFPEGESAGVYFYSIQFSKKEYHGALTVRY